MNGTAEPCGPCAAGEAASVLWQSVQVIAWLPGLTFHGARSWAATRPFCPPAGAVEPVCALSVFTTGCADLLLALNSTARSVSASVEVPVGGAPAPQAQLVWHLKQIWYSAVATP